MVSILQRRDIFTILTVLLLIVGSRVLVFPGMHQFPSHQYTPFFEWIIARMQLNAPLLFIISNLLLFTQAILLNVLCERHGIMQTKTWLPGIIFLLLSGIYPWQHGIHPHLLTNFIILILIHEIASLYEAEHSVENKLMDLGLLFCLFPLTSTEGWYFLLFLVLAVSLFIFYDINRVFLLLMSIVVPVIMLLAYYFANDKMAIIRGFMAPTIHDFKVQNLINNRMVLGPLSYPAILGILGMAMIQSVIGSIPSKVRKIYYMFLILILLEVLILVVRKNNFYSNATLIPLPLSIFVAYFFTYFKSGWMREVLFFLLLVVIVFAQLVLSKFI